MSCKTAVCLASLKWDVKACSLPGTKNHFTLPFTYGGSTTYLLHRLEVHAAHESLGPSNPAALLPSWNDRDIAAYRVGVYCRRAAVLLWMGTSGR